MLGYLTETCVLVCDMAKARLTLVWIFLNLSNYHSHSRLGGCLFRTCSDPFFFFGFVGRMVTPSIRAQHFDRRNGGQPGSKLAVKKLVGVRTMTTGEFLLWLLLFTILLGLKA